MITARRIKHDRTLIQRDDGSHDDHPQRRRPDGRLRRVAWRVQRARVELDAEALLRVRAARAVVERALASGEAVYGLNTGLGSLSRHRIPVEEIGAFAFATVADQTVGMHGRPLPTDVVRAMMLTRANGMAKAGVGVRRELVELIVALLNAGVHPIVRDGSARSARATSRRWPTSARC